MPEKPDAPLLPAFNGWDIPHFTPIPDQLFDEWLPHLSEAELKVLLYIMRRTFGFKKSADAISLRQMADGIIRRDGTRLDWGAGVTLRSVQRAVPTLLEKGLIEAHKTTTAEGDAATTVYRLRLRGSSQNVRTHGLVDYTGSDNLSGGVRTESPQQESDVQETENKRVEHPDLEAAPAARPPPYSPVIAGAILDLAQSLRDELAGPGAVTQALALWQHSGWSEAQFVAALQAARGNQRKLAGILTALARQMPEAG